MELFHSLNLFTSSVKLSKMTLTMAWHSNSKIYIDLKFCIKFSIRHKFEYEICSQVVGNLSI